MIPLSEFLQPYSEFLPSAEETLLLRVGLLADDAARRAWQEWRSNQQSAFIGNNPAIQKLRLLLSQAQQRHHFEMDKESQTFLRLSYFKEGLRREIYRNIFRNVLKALQQSAIPVIVLKGAALAETVYPPSMRHCHDIDLLLDPADMPTAAQSIKHLRFKTTESASPSSIRLEHDSQLPVELHCRLFVDEVHNRVVDEMRGRTQAAVLFGLPAQIFSPEDSFLHVCAHAFSSPNRDSLRWVSDVWRILEKHPDLEWQRIFDCVARGQLSVPLAVTLGYVWESLQAPLPPSVIRALLDGVPTTIAIPPALCDD